MDLEERTMAQGIKATYDEQGFVVIPGLIPPGDWNELEAACQRMIQKTRDGK